MGNGLGSRRTLLAIVCSATGMGCVAEAEAPSPGEQTEQRQAPVYKGDAVSDGEAFAGGHVFLRAQSSVAGMPGVGGYPCSGTFIGPNWILTARHCVFNELGAKYAKLEARIGPATSPSWQGTCPVVDIRPDANHVPVAAPILAGKLKRPVLRAFPRPPLQLAPVGCVVVGHPEPTIDIALIDLNGFPGLTRGIPGYPAWPNGTVLYGGPRSALGREERDVLRLWPGHLRQNGAERWRAQVRTPSRRIAPRRIRCLRVAATTPASGAPGRLARP
jgi:hypothetical protein